MELWLDQLWYFHNPFQIAFATWWLFTYLFCNKELKIDLVVFSGGVGIATLIKCLNKTAESAEEY